MNETQLLHAFIARVPYTLPVRIFRRNVAHGKLENGGYVRNGIKGQCDTYAVVKGTAKHIEIEAKSATGRLSQDQKQWQAFCRVWGTPHIVLVAGKDETPEETVERWVLELSALV
jgi:hypothetical protein